MLNLQHLATFVTVAQLCSFTRAAAELGHSQSSVTVQIQALEKELGAPLFQRSRFSKTIALTEEGRRAVKYAGKLLALAEKTKSAIRRRRA